MKRLVTALFALTFTAALGGAALADCPAHAASQQQTTTDTPKGT